MKLRHLLLALLMLVMPTLAYAEEKQKPVGSEGPLGFAAAAGKYDYQVPDQSIVAPETVDPGEVVIVGVTQPLNTPQYLVAATYKWKILENGKVKTNIREWPDGTSVLFGAGIMKAGETKRTFTIMLAISYLYVAKEKDVVAGIGQRSVLLTHEITMTGVGPGPGPGPNPGPNPVPVPTPVFPDGKFGLAKKSYQFAMDSVPAASRTTGAPALTNAFSGIAASVAAGTLTDQKVLLAQSKTANQTALANAKVSAADWDAFFVSLQKEIYTLYSNGKLSTIQDFADAWREVSSGLEKVK